MTKYKNKEVPDYHSPPLLPLRREMGNQFEDISQRVADFSNNHRWGNFAKIQTSVSFQDNEGRYEQHTGQVGSDGNEAGDETNLSATKSEEKINFSVWSLTVKVSPKKSECN